MPSRTPDAGGTLNPYQQRHLRLTCEHLDALLSDIEQVLSAAASKSVFPKYISDLSSAQSKTLEDYIARLRAHLLRVLDGQGIERKHPEISASHSVRVALAFLQTDIEELAPRNMRGYGEVPEAAAADLNGIVSELDALVARIEAFLAPGPDRELRQRLEKLAPAGHASELLVRLEKIVTDQGLVEFRPALSMILERLEDQRFEVAVFGRVSSGKSSLLNSMLETSVLPVGVTPITAVPTRLVYGAEPGVAVWVADRKPEHFPVDRLAEFVTEQHNPGNAKRVVRVVVELPSTPLKNGVVLVDTPGLGSLATAGATETLSYLPRCDLGIVLVDAASSFGPDDLRIMRSLDEAGIPFQVLLSKADLLVEADRATVTGYVKQQIAAELDAEPAVSAVSVAPPCRFLLDTWFQQQLLPLFARRQDLKKESIGRKVGALRESVELALRVRLRHKQAAPAQAMVELRELEARLRRSAGQTEDAGRAAERIVEEIGQLPDKAIEEAATALVVSAQERGQQGPAEQQALIRQSVARLCHERTQKLYRLLQELAQALHADLVQVAERMHFPHRPADGELVALVNEMPAFELPEADFSWSRPVLASLLGPGYARARAAQALRKHFGSRLAKALADHSAVLGSWTRKVLGQIQRRSDLYAESYRAQLSQLAGQAGPSDEERRKMEHALELLGAEPAASTVAVRDSRA